LAKEVRGCRRSKCFYPNYLAVEVTILKWTYIRATLIVATFLSSAFITQAPAQSEDSPLPFLVAAFLIGIVGLLFVVGAQRINPLSAKLWRYPNWSINPFQMREPLHFFHFAGYFMLASGAGAALHQIFVGSTLHASDCLSLIFGLGILCGVRVCTVVYKNKMVANDLD
jgi:hypothetical protein